MGHPLTYKWVEASFNTRRKTNDYKAYKTDTHLVKAEDGTFTFNYIRYEWELNKKTGNYRRVKQLDVTPLVSITPDNVMTLLAPDVKGWPSVHHMTIRNRLQEITGFSIYSDTAHHKNKETPIRIFHRFYGANGWEAQAWCTGSDKSMPYKAGTQFQVGITQGRVECLNPPTDVKSIVKPSAVQQVKGDTAVIRKLAMVMLRVGFEEHIEKKLTSYWYATPQAKLISDVNYKDPTGDDAMAVLAQGMRMATRVDESYWDGGVFKKRSMDERVSMMRGRILENGMKALRKHIYKTTDGYEKVEVK